MSSPRSFVVSNCILVILHIAFSLCPSKSTSSLTSVFDNIHLKLILLYSPRFFYYKRKTKLSNSGDNASSCFKPFWIWKDYKPRDLYHLNVLLPFSRNPNFFQYRMQYFPFNRIIYFLKIYKELIEPCIIFQFFSKIICLIQKVWHSCPMASKIHNIIHYYFISILVMIQPEEYSIEFYKLMWEEKYHDNYWNRCYRLS